MSARRKRVPRRRRVGRVSYYLHHGSWYLYYREGAVQKRVRVGASEAAAARLAAERNAELAGGQRPPARPWQQSIRRSSWTSPLIDFERSSRSAKPSFAASTTSAPAPRSGDPVHGHVFGLGRG